MQENPLYTIVFKQHVLLPYGFLEMSRAFSCNIPPCLQSFIQQLIHPVCGFA